MVEKLKYIVNLLIVVLLLATVTIQRDGRVAGHDAATLFPAHDSASSEEVQVETVLEDGVQMINTTSLAKDIIGFGGTTPVKVYIKDDMIQRVEAEPNSETPSFFDEVLKSGLLDSWQGVDILDAATMDVDIVSGATYSSAAIIGNVQRAAQYVAEIEAQSSLAINIGLSDIIGLLVVAMGVALTLLKSRKKKLIILQLILNVAVLGFWCGSFLSLTTFTTWVGNGINLSLSIVTVAMLCVVVIMPLLGKKGSYCQMHCPMGSAQELIGRIPLTKIKIAPKIGRVLNSLRYYILATLLFIMWLGVGFELMDYEIFSAFIFSSASIVVLVMAAIFLILSLFITKPYCRFICPTGALITMAQKTKDTI